MPIITEPQRTRARSGRWRWVALAVVLLLLSLPLVLTLFPVGIRVGGHRVSAYFSDDPDAGPGFWASNTVPLRSGSLTRRHGQRFYRNFAVGWGPRFYGISIR